MSWGLAVSCEGCAPSHGHDNICLPCFPLSPPLLLPCPNSLCSTALLLPSACRPQLMKCCPLRASWPAPLPQLTVRSNPPFCHSWPLSSFAPTRLHPAPPGPPHRLRPFALKPHLRAAIEAVRRAAAAARLHRLCQPPLRGRHEVTQVVDQQLLQLEALVQVQQQLLRARPLLITDRCTLPGRMRAGACVCVRIRLHVCCASCGAVCAFCVHVCRFWWVAGVRVGNSGELAPSAR